MRKLKRACDPVASDDGMRFLVERLWPRGLAKATLHLDALLTDVGPTTEPRRWLATSRSSGCGFERGTVGSSTHARRRGDRSSQRPEAKP